MLDKLFLGCLDQFEEFRQRFDYLYVCENCSRAFDSNEPKKLCKFCGSPVKEVVHDPINLVTKNKKYIWLCKNCGVKIAFEKVFTCSCGEKAEIKRYDKLSPIEKIKFFINLIRR